jgi:hypothetical protein
MIVGRIRQLFLKHGVQERLGIALLHKHMEIESTERLVECRHTSSPWKVNDATSSVIDKYDGKILPRSFRLLEGNFVPYEFEYSCTKSTTLQGETDYQFLKELSDMLVELGLHQLLGLRDLDQREPELNVEVTEGKANIMIPRGSVP